MTFDKTKVYTFEDDSAWDGDGRLAFFCGQLLGILSEDPFKVSQPNGYAPILDVETPFGTFRLTVEVVKEE